MRFCRLFLIVLLCSVVCIGLFSTSVSAAVIEEYSYNGVVLPKLPDDEEFYNISVSSGVYYLSFGKLTCSNTSLYITSGFMAVDGEWVACDFNSTATFHWTNYDVFSNSGNLIFEGSEPVVTQIVVPDPPRTMDDILGDIVDIFNSCISWVGDVGSTIMDKPILLFYAALPLCGIGVGFFKRLKS